MSEVNYSYAHECIALIKGGKTKPEKRSVAEDGHLGKPTALKYDVISLI